MTLSPSSLYPLKFCPKAKKIGETPSSVWFGEVRLRLKTATRSGIYNVALPIDCVWRGEPMIFVAFNRMPKFFKNRPVLCDPKTNNWGGGPKIEDD